ncbi:TfoX/Sxy family DNA transformation protein [Niabella yanshanensis]|uniref:TfoX/Sxy family DNA transformation protein n=1 Tax=Niabella yanshanensis TaxID=577386 RepID=A0ABZ0W9Q4_9BACT|nr:TfoX/Sxy family DNA transformation protein [Niabella yanshanensis]WQD40013.1 TfoX/Sxy family DNA transformation protein [Niabella yanshanensis]
MGHFDHRLTDARNIGPVIAQKLHEIGIHSLPALAVLTPVKAYIQLAKKSNGIPPPVSHYLYALQGALMNVHWIKLPKRLKQELLNKLEKERAGAKRNLKGKI